MSTQLGWKNYFIYLIIFICTALFFRVFFITPYKVMTDSLGPSLISGDFIFLSRLSRYADSLERGDFIGYQKNQELVNQLAQIIGVPGDYVEVIQGQLFVNKVRQRQFFNSDQKYGPVVVNPESYLVLNDLNSNLPLAILSKNEVQGTAFLVWFSVVQKELIGAPSWTKIRWQRMGFIRPLL